MASRGSPRTWFCAGCGKPHPDSREIEGDAAGQYWCRHSIWKGIKAKRNDLPPQAWRKDGTFALEMFRA